MIGKHKSSAVLLSVLMLLAATTQTLAQQWNVQLPVQHRSQQENWSCGPNTIAMWAGYLKKASFDTNAIADKYTGRDGTDLKEFENAMFGLTPYGYVFSDWAYTDQHTAIKGVMYSLARFNEPVAISGNDGGHYYLIVGGVATNNPYTKYGTQSNIQYLYLYDSRENSPIYTNPSLLKGQWGAWLSVTFWPIFKKGQRYTPAQVMYNWTPIGAWYDKKWRSIERNSYAAWGAQGATYYNRDRFSSY